MDVVRLLLSFICLSFIVVIVGAMVVALFLRQRMAVFAEVQRHEAAYHDAPTVDAQYEAVDPDPLPLDSKYSESNYEKSD